MGHQSTKMDMLLVKVLYHSLSLALRNLCKSRSTAAFHSLMLSVEDVLCVCILPSTIRHETVYKNKALWLFHSVHEGACTITMKK